VGTAEETASDFGAVADHLALAMFTHRRDGLNCTLEAIENVPGSGGNELK